MSYFGPIAVCSLIDKASRSHLPYHDDHDVIALWQQIIDECLMHNELDVQVRQMIKKNTEHKRRFIYVE